MRKISLTLSLILFQLTQQTISAQTTDTVSQGSVYANQIWYNLQNGNKISAPKNNWHIAFETNNIGSSIHINSANGVELWVSPVNDTTQWATFDTSAYNSWTKCFNSNTSWSLGAFNAPSDPNNQFDLGWGLYSMITHTVTGNRLFLIKTGSSVYKKIWIKSLASGTFTFRYANLDNTDDHTQTIMKSGYQTKNFIYFDLINNQIIDREPVSNTWDLTFTQYIEYVPSPYLVTGVLHNKNVESVKVYPVDENTYELWSNHSFSNNINTIGYDWKSFNSQLFQWNISDSTVYFIKDLTGNIWKLVFTGFGGSTNGNYIFTKKLLSTTGIPENSNISFMQLYPNPSNGNINIISDNINQIMVYDLNGKLVFSQLLENTAFGAFQIDLRHLTKGVYLINGINSNGVATQYHKLIIN